MLVPVTILLPREVATMLQKVENPSSNKSSSTDKNFGKVFQITPVPAQPQPKKEVKGTAAHYNFTPRLLGGRTPSQLFNDIEEQQKNFCQILSFDLARVPSPNVSRQASKGHMKIARKNKQGIAKKVAVRKNQKIRSRIQKKTRNNKTQKQSQKKNIRANFVPRLFGKRTPSQLFSISQYQRNDASTQNGRKLQTSREESFVPRLFGKRTPSQLFFMNRFQDIRSAPDAAQIKRNASAQKNQFVSRLFGKRTSSQLFRVSKVLRRRAQLDYSPKSLKAAQRKVKFIPRLFGQRTPSQLFFTNQR